MKNLETLNYMKPLKLYYNNDYNVLNATGAKTNSILTPNMINNIHHKMFTPNKIQDIHRISIAIINNTHNQITNHNE